MTKKISGCIVGSPLLVGICGALPLNLALLQSDQKVKWAERSGERGSKNQVERERSGSGRSSERERSGERDSSRPKWSWAMSGKIFRSAPLTCSDSLNDRHARITNRAKPENF